MKTFSKTFNPYTNLYIFKRFYVGVRDLNSPVNLDSQSPMALSTGCIKFIKLTFCKPF